MEISPLNLLIFNFATLVAFQEAVAMQVAALVLALYLRKVFYTVDMVLPFANSFLECFTL